MNVNIISYSQINPEMFEGTDVKNIEDLVAYCARVSNPSNQLNTETNEKLLKYLITKWVSSLPGACCKFKYFPQ